MCIMFVLQGVEAKDSLLTSVNKLLLLGLIPGCPENHYNVKLILDQLGLNGVQFCTTADLKLGLYLNHLWLLCKLFYSSHDPHW